MNPKAFESKRDEGRDRVAKRDHMLNICRKARGWDVIVRTPKFMYLPKKKISVTSSRVLLAYTRNPVSSKARSTRIVIARNRTIFGPRTRKSST